jgi:glycosyltransferase involved in cell wall biosynthesis
VSNLISIITVCFNSASTIEGTILSVANQKYPHKEHVIIDGASSDGTMSVVERYAHILRAVSEPDHGIYDAMNKGIAMASGEILGILNADDFYANETVLDQVASVFADATVDACYADLVYVDQKNTNHVTRYWQSKPFQHGLFEKGWMPAHPTFFVRRKIYEQFGGFDLEFPRQADFELTMRFLEVHNIKAVYVPNIWVNMRIGGVSNNSVRGVLEGNIEAYRACKKNGLRVSMLPFIVRKMLSRVPQFFKRPKVTG